MRGLQMKSFYGFVIKRGVGSGAIYKSIYLGDVLHFRCRLPIIDFMKCMLTSKYKATHNLLFVEILNC